MTDSPRLPPLYELVVLEEVDDVTAEGRRRALASAAEGTLVWARGQRDGRGRRGRRWVSAPGNLHCALVLRPEYPPDTAHQLAYVAAVSLGTALAELLSPMVSLHYRWPNDVLLGGHKVAGLWLDAPATRDGRIDWLVVGLCVNVAGSPQTRDFWATSLHALEGGGISATQVLEDFARNFLAWINRWASGGFEPVRRAWIHRAEDLGRELVLEVAGDSLQGTFDDVDAAGRLVLALPEGGLRRVSVAEFFGLPGAA